MKIKISPARAAAGMLFLVRLVGRTLRIELSGLDVLHDAVRQGNLLVYAFWHGEMFCMPMLADRLPDPRWIAIVSASKDGEVVAQVLARLGVESARGSSSREGVRALMSAVRRMKKDRLHGLVSVDGPRGPRHQAKDGALFLAAKSGALLAPVRVSYSRSYAFKKAWDRFEIPLPFSRCRISFGAPYAPEADKLTPEVLERERRRLEEKLHALG